MKAYHILLVGITSLSMSGIAMAGGRPQPSPPPNPYQPPPQQQAPPQQRPAPAPSKSTTPDKSSQNSSNSNSNSGMSNDPRRNPNYPYNYPYGYPTAGVYYPQGSYPNQNTTSSSTGSSTSTTNTNTPPTNNNPFAGTPDPAPAAGTPRTPSPAAAPAPAAAPDPELAAATAEYNAAVDHLKETLKDNPAYKAAVEEKRVARLEAAAMHEKSDVQPVDALKAAQRGLDASKRISEIEKAAMAKDDRVVAARARLDAALAAHNGGGAPVATPK